MSRLRRRGRVAFRVERRSLVGGVSGTLTTCSRTDGGVESGVEVLLVQLLEGSTLWKTIECSNECQSSFSR